MFDYFRGHCYNCGDLEFICDFRHFRDEVLIPAFWGALIGAATGAVLAYVQNTYFSIV